MTAFNYSSGDRITAVLPHVVYAKSSWAADWVEVPNLTCVECAWNAAPNFNTAILQWETGYVILPGDTSPTLFGTWTGRGQFLKIVWACDDGGTLTWVGFVDSSSWPTEAFGRQQLICYGLERSLSLTPIATSAWLDTSGTTPTLRRSAMPFTFNEGPDGYRSQNPVSGSTYAFASLHDPTATKHFWSTRKIVQYLMTYCLPSNDYGVAAVPWSLDQAAQLPDWDVPTVRTQNRTLWDVLLELINPENQLGFTVASDGSTAFLRCFTHLPSAVVYGSVAPRTIPANPNQHSVVFAPDALTTADLSDVGATYDQVIVRGDRRKTICTLLWDDHLEENNWLESLYENGASDDEDYSSWTDAERRTRNAAERANYPRTYREFRIKADWDFKIDDEFIFIEPDHATPRSLRILDTLPLKRGESWQGEVEDAEYEPDAADQELILAIVDDPTGYQPKLNLTTQLGLLSTKQVSELSNRHSYCVHVTTRDRIIDLRVEGAPQHVIASGTFSPLPEDYDVDGGIDYQTLSVTCCIEEDRFVEGIWPVSVSADVVRRLVVDLGDRYQQIYILPDTIAGLTLGAPVMSNGGFLKDDSEDLASIARLIATGLVPSRKRATWRSQRRISGIAVGDLITTAAGTTVAAPITEIRITAPTSTGRPASAPTQSFSTFGGLFDPLQILRRLGVVTT